jgi:hypothetical protein
MQSRLGCGEHVVNVSNTSDIHHDKPESLFGRATYDIVVFPVRLLAVFVAVPYLFTPAAFLQGHESSVSC